ncbi:MAG: hypothetical protein JWN75_447 [Candidatus Saccharibacteria bacterium]|nr:hypothetical protein [Candidatus Saccharibacteria bacterium]
MSNQKSPFNSSTALFIFCILLSIICGVSVGKVISNSETNGHRVFSENRKNPGDDPFAKGNAPQGGGLNEGDPGEFELEPIRPPSTPRISPEPPLVCSTATVPSMPNAQGVATFVVPEGWSVWKCIEERFGHRGEHFLVESVNYLKLRIQMDPSLKVRDPNVVPVGYTFIMGASDGAGPSPRE